MTEPSARLLTVLLGVNLTVDGPAALLRRLQDEFEQLFAADPGPGRVDASLRVDEGTDPTASVASALAEITAVAVSRSPHLCMHAGVVAIGDGLLAFPGPSGMGKTTLVAATVAAGAGYISDEVLALDRQTRAVTAFPRPLAMSAASCSLLGLAPAPAQDERLVALSELGSLGSVAALRHLVLAQRESQPTPARLEPGRRGAAVHELLLRSFNHYGDPPSSYRTAVDAVQDAEIWVASYSSAVELASLLVCEIGRAGASAAK